MSNLDISRAERLDQRVNSLFPQLSRTSASKLISDGKVTVDGAVVTKAGFKIRSDSDVRVDYNPTEAEAIPDIELPILYEDDDCIVINKPLGVLTHSKGLFNPEPTVASFIASKIDGMGGERAGIVHRLDRATSGVIICAKHTESLVWLQKQFSQRRVKKTYDAIVTGKLDPEEAIIDMPIERNPQAPATFRVGANGKHASTHYKTLQTSEKYSLLELKPETGRTHQLRVHLAHQGHPIVGDTMYNGEAAERLFLHALSLEITLYARERKTFTAPLPVLFTQKMKDN